MIKREIPVIGISTEIDIPGRISVKRKYVDAVLQAGGNPFYSSVYRQMYRFYNLWFLLLMVYS